MRAFFCCNETPIFLFLIGLRWCLGVEGLSFNGILLPVAACFLAGDANTSESRFFDRTGAIFGDVSLMIACTRASYLRCEVLNEWKRGMMNRRLTMAS